MARYLLTAFDEPGPCTHPQIIVLTHIAGTIEGPAAGMATATARPWSTARFLLVLVAGLLLPADGSAQSESRAGLGADGVVGGEIRLAPGVGMVRGAGIPILRGTAALHVSPWLLVGGETVIPLSEVRTTTETSPDRSELRLRYGGVRLGLRRPHLGDADPWTLALLVGTGTARVRSSLLATELGTDNFFVVEPSIERRMSAVGPIWISGGLAYRIPIGAQALPGVQPNQLRGASASISLEFRRNP